jgi:hypothetical protein
MSGMDTPATSRNTTISRSGLDSVAISAGSRAQCPASTRRWPGGWEWVVAAGGSSRGGKIAGGATDVPPRATPPPGPAAVLIPRTPTPGAGCRPLDPARPWPTGVCTDQAPSVRHARRTLGAGLVRLGETRVTRHRRRARRSWTVHRYPRTAGLGASRRALVGAGVRGVYTYRSRAHRFRKPVWLIKVHAGTEDVWHGPRQVNPSKFRDTTVCT